MNFKVMAIGNRLMCDDGVGILVGEYLKRELSPEVQVILAETDISYSLDQVDDDDFLIILDSSHRGKKVGEITVTPLKEIDLSYDQLSQHDLNLLRLLKIYKTGIEGIVIDIEVERVDFGLKLSKSLRDNFDEICVDIRAIITKLVLERG